MSEENAVMTLQVAYVITPSAISYSEVSEELLVEYLDRNVQLPGGAKMQVRFSREALLELLSAIRQLETHPDKLLEGLLRPRSVQ